MIFRNFCFLHFIYYTPRNNFKSVIQYINLRIMSHFLYEQYLFDGKHIYYNIIVSDYYDNKLCSNLRVRLYHLRVVFVCLLNYRLKSQIKSILYTEMKMSVDLSQLKLVFDFTCPLYATIRHRQSRAFHPTCRG